MRHVLPLYHVYHVSGTRADAVVCFSRRCAVGSHGRPHFETGTFTYPLTDLEEVDEAAHDKWFDAWAFCEDPSAARDDQPDSSVEETSDTGDADANADQDDSAKAAHDKYLSYLTFKQPTGLRNDAKSRNTLRVRDFFLYCSVPRVRAT
jgi:hypothetical protein